jgi:RNA polymerase sigma-70 factor (ECF subfamily)
VRVAACASPAYAQYKPDGAGRWLPWALLVLELDGRGRDQRVAGMTFFLDVATLYPRFGLPPEL